MATTREQLQQLQKEVRRLKIANAEMQRVLRESGLLAADKKRVARKDLRGMSERERAREILRRAGVTREMTVEEERIAVQWDALSENEKREAEETVRRVRIDPPLSQLIHTMRG
jgi:tellurite resistance protein